MESRVIGLRLASQGVRSTWLCASLLALFCVAVSQFFEIRFGLNLWDEGFLWYGVQRIWNGEIPIRDFMAYDPGRYYWVAGVASLWGGRGILDIRVAVAVFQCMGLAAGLWALGSSYERPRAWTFVNAAIALSLWMFPRHKLFDIALSLLLVALFRWWIERPVPRRYFCVGVAIGVAACFGRNHGVYAVVGSGICIAFLAVQERRLPFLQSLGAWGVGIILGFLPIALACLIVPGFAAAFWASIMFLIDLKATNLPLPIPWPWTVAYGAISLEEVIRQLLVGVAFLVLLAYPAVMSVYLLRRVLRSQPCDPALVATVCLAVPYAHYAFSRADVGHLAQGIFPALIGTFLLFARMRPLTQGIAALGVVICSAWITLPSHPALACARSGACQDVAVSGQRLVVDPGVASDVTMIRGLVQQYAADGRPFLAAPLWPGAYALMDRRSPVWEIYALTARNDVFQRMEIERLRSAKPGFVIVFDLALDGRDDLRYRNTHSLIEQYIEDHFTPLPSPNPAYHLYRAPEVGVGHDSGATGS